MDCVLFLKLLFSVFLLILWVPSGSQADYGNWFVANQRLSNRLDSTGQKLSFRFTCQDDMQLAAAAVFCADAVAPPAYKVSLQEDEEGHPSGVPLSSSDYVPRPQSWSVIPLSSCSLVQGRVYHLVLEQDVTRGGDHPVGVIGPSNCASFLSTDVLNHRHPNDGSPDPAANVLSFRDGRWEVLDQEPVYALYGAGSQLQGNPYDDPGVRPVYGGGDKSHQVLQGEAIHFHCGTSATAFALRLRRQGNPKDPLDYRILKNDFLNHKTIAIQSAVALQPSQVSPDFQWVTVGFGNARSSDFSPECWFLVFQTDSGRPSKNPPGCEDCYVISDVGNSGGLAQAAEMTFDGGPHLSRAVYSTDGGSPSGWRDEFERDANIGAICPPCIPPNPKTYPALPTPPPLLDGEWTQP